LLRRQIALGVPGATAIAPRRSGVDERSFAMYRQTVLFAGTDTHNLVGLWGTNGTTAGTYELTGVINGVFAPTGFTVFDGEVLFQGEDTNALNGLWVTHGTEAGTTELGGFGSTGISGANSSGLFVGGGSPDFTVFNGETLFSGMDASGDRGLWVTNGTVGGTTELGGLDNSGISGVYASGFFSHGLQPDFTVLNGQVLFDGLDTSGDVSLWVTNGTTAGTMEVGGIGNNRVVNAGSGLHPDDMTVFNGEVLFDGLDASGHNGLWVTNGTAVDTHEVTGISGANSSLFDPIDFTVFNGEVLFAALDASANVGLWVTNGTAMGTSEVTGISGAGPGGVSPVDLTVFNGFLSSQVLFRGTDASGSHGLWVTNGTTAGTYELTGISGAFTGAAGLSPRDLTVFNGEGLFPQVLFGGNDASGHLGLWVTDGASAGTHELTGINGGASSGLMPTNLAAVTIVVPPSDDFFGNNTSDILFRNTTSGDTWFEAISNGVFAGWNQIGGSSTSYDATGVGDFYGTGASDILFRNNSTGDTWFEAISNGAFAGWNQIGGSSTSYAVAGVGDFYGTGPSDILFRNSTSGDTWFEAISNGVFAGWHQIGGSDTHYSVVGVADFYDSGTDDILFRNNSTGDTWIEQMTNGAFAGWHQIGGSDTHYSVVGVGDFFGNGTDDILFRNNSTGDTWSEVILNGTFLSWLQIGGSNTSYSVVGIGDYFGNNTSDILFRNSTGDTWVEQITNGVFASWNHIGGSSTAYTVPITVGPPALT
jgi:ELWxxDGT repeat protein